MDQAYDLLQNAIESGKSVKKLLHTPMLRPEIVKATIITPELVARARITQSNKFDPRILFQLAVRNGDLNAINLLIGGLSNNMIVLRSLLIRIAVEEVGIGNVGLVELVLKTASAERSTFDQLLILSHAMAKSNKSDFVRALWNVYGLPENYDFARSYGLMIGGPCDNTISCLQESDPNIIYWLVKDRMKTDLDVINFIFNEIESIDQDLVEILEGLYRRENDSIYLLYLVTLAITQIVAIVKPTLYLPTRDQLDKIEAIRTRITLRQPIIDVTVSERYRSDVPVGGIGELILEVSNQLEKEK